MAVPEGKLVDEDRAEGEAAGVGQALGRHRPAHVEDLLELAVEVLDTHGAKLMEDAPNLGPGVGVRVATVVRHNERAPGAGAGGPHLGEQAR